MVLQHDTAVRQRISHSLNEYWPEYLMEAALFGFYMLAAGIFAVLLLKEPQSPVHAWTKSPFFRRLLYGVAMRAASIALVYSPWGRRSGAHPNSAITFTYWRLGKIKTLAALFYMMAQLIGGVSGVAAISLIPGDLFLLPAVMYVAT